MELSLEQRVKHLDLHDKKALASCKPNEVPDVAYPNIYNYLIDKPGKHNIVICSLWAVPVFSEWCGFHPHFHFIAFDLFHYF